MSLSFRRLFFGKPLPTQNADHTRLPIILALPIFASDALSSVAYASETILHQFKSLGVIQEQWQAALPISVAIIALILMVVISYRQVIYAYPQGGGSYVVARQNLGLMMGLIAASALLVDYILTVAVSISDCVKQSESALTVVGGLWAAAFAHKVPIGCLLVLLITLANLRGAKESGAVFAGPSYGFIAVILLMVGAGIYRARMGLPALEDVMIRPDPTAKTHLDWLLLVRGFASGCAALTGIEAVSNGVQAFKKPEDRNASVTLVILGIILAIMFIGITYLALHFRVAAEEETVISQIARAVFGTHGAGAILYYAVQLFTALILFLAANTAFAGFPRLASILAEDGFLPRQLASVGDRLSYNNGIILLGLVAMLFLVMFRGETHALLPLYTIGVFIAFTTAQAGMVRRAWKLTPRPWGGMIINGLGAVITFVVLCVVTASKFLVMDKSAELFGLHWLHEGAWMALLLMAIIVWVFYGIAKHYQRHTEQLAAIPIETDHKFHHTVIVLVPSRIHWGIVQALKYARSLSPDALAVHIAFDPAKEQELRTFWVEHAGDMPLLILESPYRSLIGPLMDYLDAADRVRTDDMITVVLPEFVPAKWWHNFLHNASGWLIRLRLFYRRDIVIASVRYYLDK